MMSALTFILWIAIFLFIVVVGCELFTNVVNDQLRCLRLIVSYAPLPVSISLPSRPELVIRYASWPHGENCKPVGCVHIQSTGRIRYGKTGRWMKMGDEAFFSLSAPGFVWHATITGVPGIRLEAFDYYSDPEAGMNLNLFFVFPLGNAHMDKKKDGLLFRYPSPASLFPRVYGSSDFIIRENFDVTTAESTIRDKDHSTEALICFNGWGRKESIASCQKMHPETSCPVSGHSASRFPGYTGGEGYRIPIQVVSEIILPEGKEVLADSVITDKGFDRSDIPRRRNS